MSSLTIETEDDETITFMNIGGGRYVGQHEDHIILLHLEEGDGWRWEVFALAESGDADSRDSAMREALETIDVFVEDDAETEDDEEDEELG
jgi:hypothetical protein